MSTVLCHILIFVPFSFSPFAVSMWTMARHQVAAPWTQWPARAQASSCRPILSTANGESRSSTAPTVTTTSRLSLCPETPPLPVTCECMMSFASTQAFIKCTQMLPVVLNAVYSTFFSLSLWICVMAACLSDQVLKLPCWSLWPWWEVCMTSSWLCSVTAILSHIQSHKRGGQWQSIHKHSSCVSDILLIDWLLLIMSASLTRAVEWIVHYI